MNTGFVSRNVTTLRLLYLLALTGMLFFVGEPMIIFILLGIQIILWLVSSLDYRLMRRSLRRLLFFFVIILLSFAFLSTGDSNADRWIAFSVFGWQIEINQSGVWLAVLMCTRVLTLVLASTWVQQSAKPGEFVRSLVQLKVPAFLALAIDTSLTLISMNGGNKKQGAGKTEKKKFKREKISIAFNQLRRGDLSFIREIIDKALSKARGHIAEKNPELSAKQVHDLAVVVGITLAIMGLKLIQLMPGLPIAPGHKNLLMIPLFLLAARMTHSRFGGLWTGLTVGVMNFMLGYGKYGILEILQFLVPGVMADLLLPLILGKKRALLFFQYCLLGGILGFGRFSANIAVLFLAGAPPVAFALMTPMLISQVLFGALSGMVSTVLLYDSKELNKTTDTEELSGQSKN